MTSISSAPAIRRSARWFPRHLPRLPYFPLAVGILLVVSAFGAPIIAPHDPNGVDLTAAQKPPAWVDGGSLNYALGTDAVGRDVLSRLIFGARTSLAVGVVTVAIAGFIGAAIGMLSGYIGGIFDAVLMRITDGVLAIPVLLLALTAAAITGPGLWNIILVLGLTTWAPYARTIRGEVLKLRSSEFISLARVAGAGPFWIIRRHVVGNILNTLVVLATLQLGLMIIAEAGLSFLGFGVSPDTPSWGGMLSTGRDYMDTAWWLSVMPGGAIMLTVLAANLAGDWLRVRLDPKLKER